MLKYVRVDLFEPTSCQELPRLAGTPATIGVFMRHNPSTIRGAATKSFYFHNPLPQQFTSHLTNDAEDFLERSLAGDNLDDGILQHSAHAAGASGGFNFLSRQGGAAMLEQLP